MPAQDSSDRQDREPRQEERGIISGYCARINPQALGLSMQALLRLGTTHENISRALQMFAETPEIIAVDRVTGEDCFVVRVLVPKPEDLERIVDSIARLGPVTTSVVLRQQPDKPVSRQLVRRTSGVE
ncbi:Lrp/AsnC family transcriptional regulator [Roseibium sp.]|uniref:Lrp/AsnC family transcriptional regulator n=1 Tax=Roseibium sp. TaxID=1936156 RepID=UPI003D10BD17